METTTPRPSAPPVTRTYEFREVLEHTGVPRNQLQRWTDAAIIRARGGAGKGTRRAYTFRNLVDVAICDRLHRLGVTEATMLKAVAAFHASLQWGRDAWLHQPVPPNVGMFTGGHHLLWLRIPSQRMGPESRIEYAGEFGLTTMRAGVAMLTVESDANVAQHIREGDFGIVVPLLDIVKNLEAKTGDLLS
jgi:DNA-binding transcriptional MerR regulator